MLFNPFTLAMLIALNVLLLSVTTVQDINGNFAEFVCFLMYIYYVSTHRFDTESFSHHISWEMASVESASDM